MGILDTKAIQGRDSPAVDPFLLTIGGAQCHHPERVTLLAHHTSSNALSAALRPDNPPALEHSAQAHQAMDDGKLSVSHAHKGGMHGLTEHVAVRCRVRHLWLQAFATHNPEVFFQATVRLRDGAEGIRYGRPAVNGTGNSQVARRKNNRAARRSTCQRQMAFPPAAAGWSATATPDTRQASRAAA